MIETETRVWHIVDGPLSDEQRRTIEGWGRRILSFPMAEDESQEEQDNTPEIFVSKEDMLDYGRRLGHRKYGSLVWNILTRLYNFEVHSANLDAQPKSIPLRYNEHPDVHEGVGERWSFEERTEIYGLDVWSLKEFVDSIDIIAPRQKRTDFRLIYGVKIRDNLVDFCREFSEKKLSELD